jgi:putative copper resistance protein D
MLEPAVIFLRLVQFAAAMILFGSSLCLIYALPHQGAGSGPRLDWSRSLLGWSAGVLLVASLAGLVAQTSVLAGSLAEGVNLSSLSAVVTTMSLGVSALVRAGAAAMALSAVLVLSPGRPLFWICATLGAVISASFAWMGHGAATEGPGGSLHLVADILHALAAGVWIGALVVFFGLLRRAPGDIAADRTLYKALHGFGGVGSGMVAVLAATGLVNSWFLVGPSRLPGLWTTPYGQLLVLKLALFVGMLGLAAANRFHLTPALGVALDHNQSRGPALTALRRSLIIETTFSFLVLGLIAWLGMLAPVSAQ